MEDYSRNFFSGYDQQEGWHMIFSRAKIVSIMVAEGVLVESLQYERRGKCFAWLLYHGPFGLSQVHSPLYNLESVKPRPCKTTTR
ncbi:hypothetical protein E2C01_038622 [Portunus trituberculatus]|uniref:Uncharacterized protein n=1 Tax=Portunus trituberculatus TaxID=210409 RepID=A0A5B7FBA4_PORTR|nr:hypothetical protein [Portunus trituberculatus]